MDDIDLKNVFGQQEVYENLTIYPVKITDSLSFYNNVNCLLLDKNQSTDINIIKMSYLQFLIYLCINNKNINNQFNEILKLVLKHSNFGFDVDDSNFNVCLKINGIIVSDQNFDNIRRIIARQNLLKLPEDDTLDPMIRKEVELAREFKNKKLREPATLEERIMSFWVATGIPLEEIKKLTIYQFNKGLERLSLLKNWEIYTYPAIKAGEQNKINDWLSHIKQDEDFADVTTSVNEVKNLT